MKRLPAIVVIVLICILFTSYSTFAAIIPSIKLDTSNNSIGTGEAFDVYVVAEDVATTDEVVAFGFDLVYSSSFELNNATIGTGFNDDSAMFADTDVAGSAFPGIPGGGDILLATLNFTPSLPGSFSLMIYSDVAVPQEGLFTTDFPQVDITDSCRVINVVPIPATFWLFGAALVTMIGLRRKPALLDD